MRIRLNVSMKLLLGFGIVLLLLLTISITSITRMNKMDSMTTQINKEFMPNIVALNVISFEISNIDVLLLKHVVESSQSDKQTAEAGIGSILGVLNKNIENYTNLVSSP